MRYRAPLICASVLAVLLLLEAVNSFRAEDQIAWSGRNEMVMLAFGGGGIYFSEFQFANPQGLGLRFHREHQAVIAAHWAIIENASCLGFACVGSVKKSPYQYHIIRIPIWFVLLLLALFCTIEIHRYRTAFHRRWIARLCVKCGYDLRVTPDQCPECGTPVRRLPRGLMETLRSM